MLYIPCEWPDNIRSQFRYAHLFVKITVAVLVESPTWHDYIRATKEVWGGY
jgi:hypothetical protein